MLPIIMKFLHLLVTMNGYTGIIYYATYISAEAVLYSKILLICHVYLITVLISLVSDHEYAMRQSLYRSHLRKTPMNH